MTSEEADNLVRQLHLLNQILTIVYANVSGVMSPEVAMEEIKRVALVDNKEK
jgi:hypothetical protein